MRDDPNKAEKGRKLNFSLFFDIHTNKIIFLSWNENLTGQSAVSLKYQRVILQPQGVDTPQEQPTPQGIVRVTTLIALA